MSSYKINTNKFKLSVVNGSARLRVDSGLSPTTTPTTTPTPTPTEVNGVLTINNENLVTINQENLLYI